MKILFAIGISMLLSVLNVTTAESANDPLSWLERISKAGSDLSYAGTFTYQADERLETIRIFHRVNEEGVWGRMEVLDGSPREVVRRGREVRCALPENNTVILDAQLGEAGFPSRMFKISSDMTRYYDVKLGRVSRVAGRAAQAIVLKPKDKLRYGYILWADEETGLMLRMRMFSETGDFLERASFNDIRINEGIDDSLLNTRYQNVEGWRVVNTRGQAVPEEQNGWVLKNPVPGFVLQSALRRQAPDGGDAFTHMLYSDGLAAVSVFIERLDSKDGRRETSSNLGRSTSVYRRVVGDYMLTALGEVPMETVKRICDGMVQVDG